LWGCWGRGGAGGGVRPGRVPEPPEVGSRGVSGGVWNLPIVLLRFLHLKSLIKLHFLINWEIVKGNPKKDLKNPSGRGVSGGCVCAHSGGFPGGSGRPPKKGGPAGGCSRGDPQTGGSGGDVLGGPGGNPQVLGGQPTSSAPTSPTSPYSSGWTMHPGRRGVQSPRGRLTTADLPVVATSATSHCEGPRRRHCVVLFDGVDVWRWYTPFPLLLSY
jgi:hypothetical protein